MTIEIRIRKHLQADDRGFNLDIALHTDSNRVVLYGPSGAGKSLTLQAIAGLLTPDEGVIRLKQKLLFDGAAGICLPSQERKVAYLFQDYALFPHLTVAQNVAFGLRSGCFNLRHPQDHPAVKKWLASFELSTAANSYPHQLSGGQRQRVALARALVLEPDILLLDEPFSALELSLRDRMRRELSELQKQLNVPMMVITHDPADLAVLGDEIFEIRDGMITPAQSART